jgi:hypothetical protein
MKNKLVNTLCYETNIDAIAKVLDEAIEWNQAHRSIQVEDLIRRLCKKHYLLSSGRRDNF